MRFTDYVASLHPAIVTIGFVVLFVGGGVAMTAFALGSATWAIVYAFSMALMMLPIIGWHYSIYRAASDRSASFVGHRGRRAFLFALCAIAMAAFLATFPVLAAIPPHEDAYRALEALNTGAMILACLSYFLAIWAAANALTRFDERRKSVEVHKTLGTFMLHFYLPIGLWFTYPRVKRVLAAPILA